MGRLNSGVGPNEASAMRIAVVVITAILAAGSAALAQAQAPSISMQTAISQAEQYIEDNQAKNDHRYLDSAAWHGDSKSPHDQCWAIGWEVDASPPIMIRS